MKIRSVKPNNHKRAFDVATDAGDFSMPYAKVAPSPSAANRVTEVAADPDFGREAFTYVLESGAEGSVHMDAVLEYNEEPSYMRDLLLYKLTVAAQDAMRRSPLSQREITRRAGTSPAQVQRLLDPTNRSKSVDRLIVLLGAMDCEVDFTVRPARSSR
ncbi:MAG: XRE family transcriptional regulator [Coriobacteriia bacterium]|nr:XRE family transcriptional regulator [Coriobacteriia bacterium]